MPITLNGDTGIVTPMYNGSITANAVTPSVNMKNRIINGAMVIDQRNAGASISAVDNAFAVDRWRIEDAAGSGSKGNIQQNQGSVTPPAGFTNYVGFTTTSAYSVGANDAYAFQQRIEGFNTADLDFGKSTAKTVTLSFWVQSSLTGTFGGSLRNNAANRNYPFSYTITTANTWEYETITISGDTTGTWLTTNGMGIMLSISLGAGTSRSGTAGAWNSNTNNLSATGATSVVGTNGATFYITGVQLEVGSTATSFDYRPYGTEFQLCQRYCPVVSSNDRFGPVTAYTGAFAWFSFRITTPTRTPPTGTSVTGSYIMYTNGTAYSISSLSFDGSGSNDYATITVNGSGLPTTGAFELRKLSGDCKIILTGCEL
jgi:hypothetical protein